MIVGSMAEAREIHAHLYRTGRFCGSSGLPKGWEYAGGGAYRSVYAGPSGCVYKVEREPSEELERGGNIAEYRKALILATEGLNVEGCRIPEFTCYQVAPGRVVMAMERIQGETLARWQLRHGYTDEADAYSDLRDNLVRRGLRDLHSSNLMVEAATGALVVIDIGL